MVKRSLVGWFLDFAGSQRPTTFRVVAMDKWCGESWRRGLLLETFPANTYIDRMLGGIVDRRISQLVLSEWAFGLSILFRLAVRTISRYLQNTAIYRECFHKAETHA